MLSACYMESTISVMDFSMKDGKVAIYFHAHSGFWHPRSTSSIARTLPSGYQCQKWISNEGLQG